MSIRRFVARIFALADRFPSRVDRMVEEAAVGAMQAVVLGTPVDTGRARGNWQASVGVELEDPIEREDQSGASTIAENTSIIRARGRSDSSVYIANNVPYIQRLNQGWSAQAPAGFVDEAVSRAAAGVRRRRLL